MLWVYSRALYWRSGSLFAGQSLLGLSLGALTETVAETATHHLQVAHAASASGLPPLGLDGPVVYIGIKIN